MKSELISIVVLVYNTEQYVVKCLNSILNQTYKNIEIIVINDGSTDKSAQKLNKLANKDNRIRIIDRENKGRYLSRLDGYKEAKGKYIIYVDSDDWIAKNTIEVMYNAMKESKADAVRCQYKRYENDSIVIPKSVLNRNVLMNIENFEPQFFDLLYKTNYCNTICKQLMKKSVMKNINKIQENLNYSEDLACNLEIYKTMKSILFMPDELYVYNLNHSYRTRNASIEEVTKKMEDAIYVYYNLYLSTKEFEIKNKKEYRKVAAMRMIEKLSILLDDLIKTGISKNEFVTYTEFLLENKKIVEIFKVLENCDYDSIFIELKHLTKRNIKNCELLLNKKISQIYTFNKVLSKIF